MSLTLSLSFSHSSSHFCFAYFPPFLSSPPFYNLLPAFTYSSCFLFTPPHTHTHTSSLSSLLLPLILFVSLSFSLSMDNSSVFLRAAVCLPAYCDFHWDSFRDHSHLSRELEPWLQREINHSHLILTHIHSRTLRSFPLNFALFCHSHPPAFCFFKLTYT